MLPYFVLASALCALVAWLMPTHQPPWASFHAEAAAAVAGVFAVAGMLWRSRSRAWLVPHFAVLASLAALIPVVQLMGGVISFLGDATLASLYLLGFALMQVAGRFSAEEWSRERALEAFSWLVLVGALASMWLALYQWQQLDYLGEIASDLAGMRPYANLNQPNHLATLLVLGLIATACLFDLAKIGPVPALLLVAAFGLGLAMTQSRAGVLEVLVAGVLLIVKRRALIHRLAVRHALTGAGLVLGSVLLWPLAGAFMDHETGRDLVAMTNTGTRATHWISMVDAMFRHPWWGFGWNGTLAAQFTVAAAHPATHEALEYSHNLLLDLWVWNGLVVGSIIAAGVGFWFWVSIRQARDSTTLLALAGVCAVFSHALVEYPLYYLYFLLPSGFLAGVVSAGTAPRRELWAPVWLLWMLLGIFCLAIGVILSDYLGLERDMYILRFEQARIGLNVVQVKRSNPVLLTQVNALLQFARTPERNGMMEEELRSMAKVVKRYPSGPNAVRYAAALAINNRPAQAMEVLRPVCKLAVESKCSAMKELWTSLGSRNVGLAKVPWPDD